MMSPHRSRDNSLKFSLFLLQQHRQHTDKQKMKAGLRCWQIPSDSLVFQQPHRFVSKAGIYFYWRSERNKTLLLFGVHHPETG